MINTTNIKITERSLQLFIQFAGDAGNWSGTPLVSLTAAQRGNLVQLKKAGLVRTFESDDQTWLSFTELGYVYACEQSEDFKRCYGSNPEGVYHMGEPFPAYETVKSEAPAVPHMLADKSDRELAAIANAAVKEHGLPKTWDLENFEALEYATPEILHHIDAMCNEFGLTPDETGRLIKIAKTEAKPNQDNAIMQGVMAEGQDETEFVEALGSSVDDPSVIPAVAERYREILRTQGPDELDKVVRSEVKDGARADEVMDFLIAEAQNSAGAELDAMEGHDCIDIENKPTGQPCAACRREVTEAPKTELEELEEQRRAAEAKIAEIKEAERKAKEEAERQEILKKRRAENEAVIVETTPYMEALAAAVKTVIETVNKVLVADGQAPLGTKVELVPGQILEDGARLVYPTLNIEGAAYGTKPELDARYASTYSRFRQGRKIGYQISFGWPGERKTYPQLKAGGFSYDKIAKELVDRILRARRSAEFEAETRSAKERSEVLVAQLRGELGLGDWGSLLRPSTSNGEQVVIKIEGHVTPEQAKQLILAARAAGLEVK